MLALILRELWDTPAVRWLVGLVALVAVLSLTTWVAVGAWNAHEAAVEKRGWDKAVAARAVQDAKHLADDTADAIRKEREFAAKLAAAEALRLKEKADHEKDKADAVAAAYAGRSGMHCPRAVHADAPPASADPAAKPDPEEDERLLPQAAGDILDAAGDSAQDVWDFNALVDQYEALRLYCNATPPPYRLSAPTNSP